MPACAPQSPRSVRPHVVFTLVRPVRTHRLCGGILCASRRDANDVGRSMTRGGDFLMRARRGVRLPFRRGDAWHQQKGKAEERS
jgi:hypothetical protein